MAAYTAKLAVLQASDGRSSSHTPSKGMNSCFKKEKRKITTCNTLNPVAKEYEPADLIGKRTCWTLTEKQKPAMDTRPKKMETLKTNVLNQQGTYHQRPLKPVQSMQDNATTVWLN